MAPSRRQKTLPRHRTTTHGASTRAASWRPAGCVPVPIPPPNADAGPHASSVRRGRHCARSARLEPVRGTDGDGQGPQANAQAVGTSGQDAKMGQVSAAAAAAAAAHAPAPLLAPPLPSPSRALSPHRCTRAPWPRDRTGLSNQILGQDDDQEERRRPQAQAGAIVLIMVRRRCRGACVVHALWVERAWSPGGARARGSPRRRWGCGDAGAGLGRRGSCGLLELLPSLLTYVLLTWCAP